MKKRFFPLTVILVCLFALCAHAVSIRFEGEDEAKLGDYMVAGESYRLYADGYDSPDTVTFYTPDDYHACTADYCKITEKSEMSGYAAHTFENGVCTVCDAKKPVRDIDGDGVYDIQTAEDFLSFAEKVNAGETTVGAKLMNDIDFTGKTLIPVGTAAHPYAGTFDGKGYTLRGIDCEATSDNFGLFGVLFGTVRDLKAEGEIRITGNATYVGGVVGRAKSTLTEDGAVLQNIVSKVNITGDGVGVHIGGVLGSSEGLEGEVLLEGCLYGGKIELPNSQNSIGGVMGYANDGVVIYRCGFTGSVSVIETGYPGGILGYVNNADFGGILYSFSAGTAGGAIVGDAKKCGYGIVGNTYTAGQKLFGRASDEAAIYVAYNTEIADWSSGEATYLMNDGMTSSSNVRWRQTLGTDAYPNFDGEIVYCTSRNSYSNTRPDAFVLIEPDYGSGVLLANVRYIKTGYILAIAYYKDGRLQEVSLKEQQPPLEGVISGTILNYGDADEIRVMIFDYNIRSLKPLCISDVYRPEKN